MCKEQYLLLDLLKAFDLIQSSYKSDLFLYKKKKFLNACIYAMLVFLFSSKESMHLGPNKVIYYIPLIVKQRRDFQLKTSPFDTEMDIKRYFRFITCLFRIKVFARAGWP